MVFYRLFIGNESRFVIFIYYECRYAQFALSSVIELPRIPAYYPKVSFRRKRILRYCPLVISFLVKI